MPIAALSTGCSHNFLIQYFPTRNFLEYAIGKSMGFPCHHLLPVANTVHKSLGILYKNR